MPSHGFSFSRNGDDDNGGANSAGRRRDTMLREGDGESLAIVVVEGGGVVDGVGIMGSVALNNALNYLCRVTFSY